MKRRNTPTKEAVLAVLSKSGKALSQDSIEKEIDIAINRATIYRVLNRFCDDGVIHKIVAEDGKQYFALTKKSDKKTLENQHLHFNCVKCKGIECLNVEINFSIPEGYLVENVNCILTGVCKECLKAKK
ncbi:transcriptional repressor [Lutibacter sp. A80]|uniref:Fur family transcriptional regulator n=1 Tax=Lutibacter sp. A80 TaxID=2918453 RepID=UPI001F0711DE|nr:transcriptional repressor [Lutibacter sp. A80]UMB59294.1 transcriptional repressor [Lutibacter sp. A80]